MEACGGRYGDMKDTDSFKSVYDKLGCIVLDTSFLVELFSKPGLLDDFRERFMGHSLTIPRSVYNELAGLAGLGGRVGGVARLALGFVEDFGIVVVDEYDSDADGDVVRLAIDRSCYVATCDGSVMKRCRDRGVRLIYLWKGVLTID